MFRMRAYPLLGQVGGGFLDPKWHSPIGSMPFHRAQKTLDFQGPKGIGEDTGVGNKECRWRGGTLVSENIGGGGGKNTG
jgi:hypothetical protein